MELGIFERQLRLMELLAGNRTYTIDDICRKLDVSRRTVYRYLELFRDTRFKVEVQGNVYRLDKESPFFKQITSLVHFTEDEAVTLRRLLFSLSDHNAQARALRFKLDKLYDFGILNDLDANNNVAQNISALYEAQKQHQQVVLHDYNSPHSNSVSNRLVEPFQFLNANDDVRCYEPSSGMNKTFKVARIGRVEVIDLLWQHEMHHHQLFTDVFGFSAEQPTTVTLQLDRLASGILREEYPQTARWHTPLSPDAWQVALPVCNFQGVGRFVMGLFEHISVVDSPDFEQFLQQKIADLTKKTW